MSLNVSGFSAQDRYAVLLKVFFWDDSIERHLKQLQPRCPEADLWIIVDDTHGYVERVPCGRVFRSTEADMLRMGLPNYPAGKLNWYNVDYPLLAFYEVYPEYPYYLMIEHDAVAQRDLDAMVAEITAEGLDMVATPIGTPIDQWGWAETLEQLWPRNRIEKYLFNIAVFSRTAVGKLLQQRRAFARRFAADELKHWPFSEGFIPSALRDSGCKLGSLEQFGSIRYHNWWPPYHEAAPPELEDATFVHPVLSGRRYAESALRYAPVESWFDPRSEVRRKLNREAPENFIPLLLDAMREKGSISGLIALHQAIEDFDWAACKFDLDAMAAPLVMAGEAENLALGRFAYQSSISPWSRGEGAAADAANAVNGAPSGNYAFHTGYELHPWWMVDLGRPCFVREIRLFNRLTAERERTNALSIWRSANGRGWHLVHRHVSETTFGGADGHPLIVACGHGMVARFIRIELEKLEFLHLDQVEIWGVPFPR